VPICHEDQEDHQPHHDLAPEINLRLVEKPDGSVHSELIEEGVARFDQLFVARLSGERYIRGRNKPSQEFVSRQKLMVWKREELERTVREKFHDTRRRNSAVRAIRIFGNESDE
jgi:hypothetical protein